MSLSFILGLLLHVALCQEIVDDEQPCSRFEFDHKLLESRVRLELLHAAMKEELTILKNMDSTPSIGNTNSRGGNYIRWGRTTCPENIENVYKGYAGGSWYMHSGAASNYLCLPEQPQWSDKTKNDNTQSSMGAQVYGAEYQLEEGNMGFFGDDVHQDNVPCVVCETPRSKILMIPGRITCYDGWTVEYVGYLTAGHHGHTAASEYVCLDETPEKVSYGKANENGKLFYLAEARCGSLKCPPYVDGRVLSCVVCSK